jgi:hypothetical protein
LARENRIAGPDAVTNAIINLVFPGEAQVETTKRAW